MTVLSGNQFFPTLRKSLVFTVGSIAGQFSLGLLAATFFRRRFPLSTFLRSLLLLPWLFPVTVATALWRSLVDQDSGPINTVLNALGLIDTGIPWLSSPSVALLSVITINIWIGIPFNVAILYGGLQDIPDEFYEAVSLDGAGPWRSFRSITWPLLRPTVTVVMLLGVIYTLRSLDVDVWRAGELNTAPAHLVLFPVLPAIRVWSGSSDEQRPDCYFVRLRVVVTPYLPSRHHSLGANFRPGIALEEAFGEVFSSPLPEELNTAQSLTIVAASVDSATERIVRFLNEDYGVPINVFFVTSSMPALLT